MYNPADDYVAEFTSDVPLARVLRASDILEPAESLPADAPRVSIDTTLEDLLPILAQTEAVAVVAGEAIAGAITPKSVVAALARGTPDQSTGEGLADDTAA